MIAQVYLSRRLLLRPYYTIDQPCRYLLKTRFEVRVLRGEDFERARAGRGTTVVGGYPEGRLE